MNKNIKIEKFFSRKEYNDKEKDIIKNIFGILPSNVYFYTKIDITLKDDINYYNMYGLSGDGKTVIKNELKDKLLLEDFKVIDFDDDLIQNFTKINKDLNIIEAFDIKDNKDDILKMLSYFGFYEMRLLFEQIQNLSNGQQTRLKYVYMVYLAIKETKEMYILIDEFLTFVDSLSSISFARGMIRFLKDYKNINLFTFGVNDSIVGQFEDKTLGLSNGKLAFEINKLNNQNKYEINYVNTKSQKDTSDFIDNLNKFKLSNRNEEDNVMSLF